MKGKTKDHWMELCEQAAVEQDSEKLLELINQIDQMLEEKDQRLTWIIHQGSSQKRKDALKGMMNTGFADPAFPFGASIT